MRNRSLESEATACRELARDFAGQPEEHFLLQLASAMEELALVQLRVDLVAERCKALPTQH